MRWRTYVLFATLLSLCMIHAKPIDNTNRQEESTEETNNDNDDAASLNEKNDSVEETTETKTAEKKDNIEENSNENENENETDDGSEDKAAKKDAVETIENDSPTTDQAEANEKDKVSEVEEENSDEDEGDKKDNVPEEENVDENREDFEDESASKKENVPENENDNEGDDEVSPEKKNMLPSKKELIKRHHHHGHHGHEGCHHCGDEEHHEGEHGHHEHDHHEHDHHHHDHGYEFYEEWGEHGGHEGEHHGHEEGHHHGEQGCHEHHDHDEDFGHHHGGGCGGGGGGGGYGGYGKKSSVLNSNNENAGKESSRNKNIRKSSGNDEEAPKQQKKWWMVGDHWGGWGKDHFGHPHIQHENGGWQYHHTGLGHINGNYKSVIPDCCKSVVTSKGKKRNNCACNKQTTEHHGGYHFHDHGSGHNNHDHELQGHWTFGYDHFGDDWHDWDHNQGNFDHLQHMEHESHESHGHCGGGCSHGCGRRGCIPQTRVPVAVVQSPARIVRPAVNIPITNYRPAMLQGVTTSIRPMPINSRVYHICHGCQTLPLGGSRCLCKSVRQPVNIIVPQYQRQVYIDCDSAVHKFPFTANCVARTDLPVPKKKKEKTGKTKQGVVYPYVGYGPWAAYPWTADWWGGHGHHGWGSNRGCNNECSCGNGRSVVAATTRSHCDCHHEHEHEHCGHHGHCHHHHGHHCHHDHHGHHQHHHCDHEHEGHHGHHKCHHHCDHHHDHEGHHHECCHDHEHHGHHGHCCHHCHNQHHHDHHGHHHCHEHCHEHHGHHGHHKCHTTCHCDCHHFLPMSQGAEHLLMNNAGALPGFHCHDVIDNPKDGSESGSKRFCVPIGYRGGYGWPYWHGYPGVGTGLWGWGWPWIKNKVPGSKNKTSTANGQEKTEKPTADSTTQTATRSLIPAPNIEEKTTAKSTKKQTIHVGYGYASGDNYRLGYGYGGMGGVAGFQQLTPGGPGPFSRSNIPKAKDLELKANNLTPEVSKDVTGTKRNSGLNPPSLSTSSSHLGHPSFKSLTYQNNVNEVIKDRIPDNKQAGAKIQKLPS